MFRTRRAAGLALGEPAEAGTGDGTAPAGESAERGVERTAVSAGDREHGPGASADAEHGGAGVPYPYEELEVLVQLADALLEYARALRHEYEEFERALVAALAAEEGKAAEGDAAASQAPGDRSQAPAGGQG
jgi:hypothetical protein